MSEREHPVAIVSGGAQGIGLAISRTLLEEGWSVASLDTDDEALQALAADCSAPTRLLTIVADVSSEDAVRHAVSSTVETFGHIDGVVNNAGIADPFSGSVQDLSLEDWNRWLGVNLTGAFLLTKHTTGHLADRHGAIVNIASTRALQSEPDSEAYAASKGGLLALTHALSISLSGRVRVNAISPGWIAVEGHRKPSLRSEPELTPDDHAMHPAGRVGRPADIATLCSFLLSERAAFITGENMVADGGMTRKMIY